MSRSAQKFFLIAIARGSPAAAAPEAAQSQRDFEPLPPEEYAHLREDIARNGVLDALTARRDGTIVTGENRWRILTELLASGSERVKKIPVRYYLGELSEEQEYDILEGDNLFRRHRKNAGRARSSRPGCGRCGA